MGPYHIARQSKVNAIFKEKNFKTTALEFAGRTNSFPWKTNNLIKRITLFPDKEANEVSPSSYILETLRTLNIIKPEILAICGYDQAALFTALVWAKIRGKITILLSASKEDDLQRRPWKEWLKRQIVRNFDAALVGGSPQKQYAISLGIPEDRVFTGYDVVDNEHFARGADAARAKEAELRRVLELSRPFFLTVCRFIEKKNLFRLLEAYRGYRQINRDGPWDLVLCGSGPLEARLKENAANLPGVHFPGFKQADELPAYYGLAEAFILPSSHFEQWGLVVNEAMASRLPVLVSKACGCAPDLIRDGVNGFAFDPFDIDGLAWLMVKMGYGEVDLKAMGEASRRIIADWTPDVFARNLFRAVEAALAAKKGGRWWRRRA
jgi:glycosyltransferase involved in cell wall biosynthesis